MHVTKIVHFIQLGVARMPVINNCPPNVLASFFSLPSNFSRYFSFMAVVFLSSLFVTYEYLTYFDSLILASFWINWKIPIFGAIIPVCDCWQFIAFFEELSTISAWFVIRLIGLWELVFWQILSSWFSLPSFELLTVSTVQAFPCFSIQFHISSLLISVFARTTVELFFIIPLSFIVLSFPSMIPVWPSSQLALFTLLALFILSTIFIYFPLFISLVTSTPILSSVPSNFCTTRSAPFSTLLASSTLCTCSCVIGFVRWCKRRSKSEAITRFGSNFCEDPCAKLKWNLYGLLKANLNFYPAQPMSSLYSQPTFTFLSFFLPKRSL